MVRKKSVKKSKKAELPFNNLQAVTELKEQYKHLCKMFKSLGTFISIQKKELDHPHFTKTILPQTHGRIANQFAEISEQLVNIGANMDILGGNKVKKKIVSNIKPEKEFVSNIKPEEKPIPEDDDAMGRVDGGYDKHKGKKFPDSDIDIRSH